MKKITLFIFLILILGTTSCKNDITNKAKVQLITAEEMKGILELEDAQIIDVRTKEEHQKAHIQNAQNIDFNSPTFNEDVAKLDKQKPVILYCKGGARSAKCAQILQEAGFQKIYDLEGGLSKWRHSNILKIKEKS